MSKFHVERRAFGTGEWYTATKTNNRDSAESAMRIHSYGRDARIIDARKGKVIASWPGDQSLYKDRNK